MKIGFDAKRYYHNNTGLGSYSRNLVNALKECRSDLDIRLYDLKGMQRSLMMGRMAAGDGCDIFHGLSNELPLDIRASGIKSVITVHDLCWKTFPQMYHLPDIFLHDFKCRKGVQNADRIVAISESTKRDIVEYYDTDPDKVTTIYQCPNAAFFLPTDKKEAAAELKQLFPSISGDFLLYVGSINERKNLMKILEALSSISPENRPQLVVCGDGRKYAARCKAFAQSKLKKSDVVWHNHADTGTLKLLYSTTMALIYPSFYEGFGLPVAEALLQGNPVITSNVSSLPEAAGPGGILVHPSDAGQLADAISRICGSENLRRDLAARGRAYCIENFSKEKAAGQYAALYESLSDRKSL